MRRPEHPNDNLWAPVTKVPVDEAALRALEAKHLNEPHPNC